MSDNMQTVVEATKIVGKYALLLAMIIIAIKVAVEAYIYYGVLEQIATMYGPITIFMPMLVYVVASMVWVEAKHNVWKRNKGIE